MSKSTRARARRGSIVIFTALAMTVLLGAGAITIDYGRAVIARWEMQTAVDAGTLAGAQELANGTDDAVAADVAVAVAEENLPEGIFTASFPEVGSLPREGALADASFGVAADDVRGIARTISSFFAALPAEAVVVAGPPPPIDSIALHGEIVVPMTFARILGVETVQIEADSEAGVAPVSGAAKIRPWGVQAPMDQYVFGQTYELKLGPSPGGAPLHGNFHALALGGNGANVYRNNVKYGYDGMVRVGDMLTSEPGNMSGPTTQGVNYVVGLDSHNWSYYSAHFAELMASPRLVTVPVIYSWAGAHGRTEIMVVGFARFFLESVGGSGNDNFVYGRFVKCFTSNAEIDGYAEYFGAASVRLVK